MASAVFFPPELLIPPIATDKLQYSLPQNPGSVVGIAGTPPPLLRPSVFPAHSANSAYGFAPPLYRSTASVARGPGGPLPHNCMSAFRILLVLWYSIPGADHQVRL